MNGYIFGYLPKISHLTLALNLHLLLDFCKSADRLYIQASPEKKRQILKLIGSNFIYKSGNVAITLNPAFDFLLNCDLCRMVGDAGLEPTTPTMSM